jgi:hypothetical protein
MKLRHIIVLLSLFVVAGASQLSFAQNSSSAPGPLAGASVGQKCSVNADCASDACDAYSLVCVRNQCADHRTDGAESDVDCGGPTCARCQTGRKCGSNTDCVAGHVCSATHVCQ